VELGAADRLVRLLVVNAGSSSLKLRMVEDDDTVAASADLDAEHGRVDDDALTDALDSLGAVDVAGHRVVHGGMSFRSPVVVDNDVLAALDELVALAPLHQPTALAMIRTIGERLPDVPNVACFDTAFHATLPAFASTYAIPARWRDELGVRRYGFHGLSHSWASRRAPEVLGRDAAELRVVSCHLGAGASLAAVRDGTCVDTTMGFTPLDGLVMMTRSGALDPGAVAWLVNQAGLRPDEVEHELYYASGIQALAGTSDMREVEAGVARGEADATFALDVYVHRLRASIAAMVASLGGLDVLAFTGGVGEHSALVRSRAADGLGFLGVAVDESRNSSADGDADISPRGAPVQTVVVTAREELEIARLTRSALSHA
jgi:acetate kinase